MKTHLSLITLALIGLNSVPGAAAPGYGYGGNPWPQPGYGSPSWGGNGNWSGGEYPPSREMPPWGGDPYENRPNYPANPQVGYPPSDSWNRGNTGVRPGSYGTGYYYPGYYYGENSPGPSPTPQMDYSSPYGSYGRSSQENRNPDYYWGGKGPSNMGNYSGGAGNYSGWSQNNAPSNRGSNYQGAPNPAPNWGSNPGPRYQAPVGPAVSPWSESNSYGEPTPGENPRLNRVDPYTKPNSSTTPEMSPQENHPNTVDNSWGLGEATGGLIPSPAGGPPAGSVNPDSEKPVSSNDSEQK